jgi:hypothetical protein
MKLELHTMNGLGQVIMTRSVSSKFLDTSVKQIDSAPIIAIKTTAYTKPMLEPAPTPVVSKPMVYVEPVQTVKQIAVEAAKVTTPVISEVQTVVQKPIESTYIKPVIDAPAIISKPNENIMSNINTAPLTNIPVTIPKTLPVVAPAVQAPAPAQPRTSFIENLNKTITSVADSVQKVTATASQVKQVFNTNQQTVKTQQSQQQQNTNSAPPAPAEESGMSTELKIGLAVGGALLLTGIAVAVVKRKKKNRSGMGRLSRKVKKTTKQRSSRSVVKRKAPRKKVKQTVKRKR